MGCHPRSSGRLGALAGLKPEEAARVTRSRLCSTAGAMNISMLLRRFLQLSETIRTLAFKYLVPQL